MVLSPFLRKNGRFDLLFSSGPWDKITSKTPTKRGEHEGSRRESSMRACEMALEEVLECHNDDLGSGCIITCGHHALGCSVPGRRVVGRYKGGRVKTEVAMKEFSSIEELIRSKNLTTEELELHKELIEECRVREQRITEFSKTAQLNLEKLSQSLVTLKQRAVVLGDALRVLQERADNLYLKLLPEEIFYRE
jgi:hypothetical protein